MNLRQDGDMKYSIVEYLHDNPNALQHAEYFRCFATAYGNEGMVTFYDCARAALSPDYDLGAGWGKRLKASADDELAFVIFVLDTLTDGQKLGFRSGFGSIYGNDAAATWTRLLGVSESGVFGRSRSQGEGLKAGQEPVFAIVQYVKDSVRAEDEKAFAVGFGNGFGSGGTEVALTIISAAKSDWYDDGQVVGSKYQQRELQSWQLTAIFAEKLPIATRPNYLAYKTGFIVAFTDQREGQRVFEAVEGASNVGGN